MWALPITAFGLRLGHEDDTDADLRIAVRRHAAPTLPLAYERRIAGSENPTSTVFSDGKVFVEHFHATGPAFAVDTEQRLVTAYPNGASDEVVEHHLFDHIVPATLQLLGRLCFHASAVAFERGVIAFAAPSGTGKSTLAAFLSRTRSLVTDDALAIEIRGDVVVAHPSVPGTRLRADSTAAIGGTGVSSAGKTRVDRVPAASALPLIAICCLRREGENPSLEPRRASDTLPDLLQEIHRLTSEDRSVVQREMTQLMDVLAVVPTYRLRLPAAFDRLPEFEHLLTQL